jgi:homoserine O-acetyltransferase
MATTLALPPAADLFVSSAPFALDHDVPLDELLVTYELHGPRGAPLVVVQGGVSADAHVAESPRDPRPGWWSALVGPRRAVDSTRLRVLSLDFLGRRDDERFVVSSGDQARATALLLDELDVERVHAFVGASYGGMVALRFAELFPGRVERLVAISAPDRPRVFATAWRALQRRVVELGSRAGVERDALVLARAMGMLSYRSAQEFEERFAEERGPSDVSSPVEEYLLARGRDFTRRFDAAAYARLSRAIDLHRADVARVSARTTLIAADPDLLVPPSQLEELASRFARPARFVRLRSRFGHDAFLKESATLAPLLAELLTEELA